MKNLIDSKAFPWIAAVLVGALMGFLVGPLVTGWLLHESLPMVWRFALGIVASGIVGLVIEAALARRPAAVDPDRKLGKVDKVFGTGRVIFTVTPNDQNGRIQFNITATGISGKSFRGTLLPMLHEIEGVEWGTPVEPGPYQQRQLLKSSLARRDALAKGIVPKQPPMTMERTISGVITSEASLARVFEQVEERLGSAQPL
ncbi:MAG: hypothetical protein C0469_15195 [Cyanobacteria bacterium DS2.3.42]|nr:hypothetical protein [Cyanobacteria bacterium DS2.3.42]